uniref:Uncharacterized protein n=1 Tax=Cyprinus carpio TaxID=7962 RepID=A0A8C2JIW4_CYPCA
ISGRVAFAAARDLYYTHDHRLAGHTSLKELLIYSSAIFFMEGLSVRLQQKHCPLPVRLTIYTLFIYLREFSWGFLLRLFGACPWDYSELRYNFIGLTLKYVVPWALAALIAKKQIIRNTLKIPLHITLIIAEKPFMCLITVTTGKNGWHNTKILALVWNQLWYLSNVTLGSK